MTTTLPPRHLFVAGGQLPGAFPTDPAPVVPTAQEVSAIVNGDPPAHLDWESRHDPRSREFSIRRLMTHPVPVQDHRWPTGPVLDQASDSHPASCVGFAAAAVSNALEAADGGTEFLTAADAHDLFDRAQELDHVPGEDPRTGTSVLAVMKAGTERFLWDGYGWAFGTGALAQAVLQVGPVQIGVPWLSGMNQTDPDGIVQVTGSAGMGHSVAVIGIAAAHAGRRGPWFIWQNSVGESYGAGGFGYVHHQDLGRLLAGAGEAAVPITAPSQVFPEVPA